MHAYAGRDHEISAGDRDRRDVRVRSRLEEVMNRSLTTAMALVALASGVGFAQAPTTAADSLAVTIAIYTAAFGNGTQTAHTGKLPEVVCVRGITTTPLDRPMGRVESELDPPAEVVAALQKDRTLLVRPMSACRREQRRPEAGSMSLIVDTLSGKRGISISVSTPVFGPSGTFTFTTGYYEGMRSSGGWTCEGRRERSAWVVTKCEMRWIS
jgi:hypothetical protein